jgi:hypothetical protein
MATVPSVSINHRSTSFCSKFVEFWWIAIPGKLRRYSTLLWSTWSDGVYLTAWPLVALALVLAAFLFGFIEGSTHWSYRTIVGSNGFAGNVLAPSAEADGYGGPTRIVFADNLVLLIVAVGIGTLSANLGLTLVIGYALGDILLGRGPVANLRFNDVIAVWISLHVPLLVSYLLFFLLASMPILMAIELTRSSHSHLSQSQSLSIPLVAVIEALLIYCWGCMAPMVFRTVQLWSGGVPRMTVPFYSHVVALWLVPTAGMAVLLRAVLRSAASPQPEMAQRIQATSGSVTRTDQLIPRWAKAIVAAGILTLLMTGFLDLRKNWAEPNLFSNYLEAYAVFAGLAAAFLIHAYVLPRLRRWREWSSGVEQYPAVLRLAAATIASYFLCLALVAIPGLQSKSGAGEFGPEVATILVGLVLAFVLLPHGWAGLPVATRIMPGRGVSVSSKAAQAGIVGALVLIASRKAFGDCYDCACCFTGCLPGVAAAAAAGGIPGLGGIAGPVPPIAKGDPCAPQEKAYKDAVNNEKQAQQDWNKADQALTQALKNQEAARSMAQQQWQLLQQDLQIAFGSAGAAELSTLPANITQMTQAQFDQLLYWLQHTASNVPNPNFVQQMIVAPLTSLYANLGAVDNAVQQATANVDAATAKLNDARAQVASAEKALSDCLAAHPHAHPLGAPPPPKSA